MSDSQLAKGEEAQHLTSEWDKQKKVVSAVMEKWQGDGFAARCNEGMGVQAAVERCKDMTTQAQAVAPKGEMFGVQYQALSDRAYSKYGGANKVSMDSGKPNEMTATKPQLSDRKKKK